VEFQHNLNLLQIREVKVEGMIKYMLEHVSCTRVLYSDP
jgi:hypothetical protein